MEQCNAPWHTVACYTGQNPVYCEDAHSILEDVREFALAHLRTDMDAVNRLWDQIQQKLGLI
jgi:hypothetical protein